MNLFHKFHLLLLLTGFLSLSVNLHAQENSPFNDGNNIKKMETNEGTSLIGFLQRGGWAMYPLGILSMTSIGLIVYNAIHVREKSLIPSESVDRLQETMSDLNIAEAMTYCSEKPSPLTEVVGAGLSRIHGGSIDPIQMEKSIEIASQDGLAGSFVFVNYLQSIAAVAPMVGLLGTVSGMVKAFQNIAASGLGKPEEMAGNISEALITTASGLIVAIPALLAYFYFKNKFGKISSKIAKIVDDLFFNLLKTAQSGGNEETAVAQ